MAEKRQSNQDELRQEIAHSRDRLARDLSGLRYELDFPQKFRRSFQRNAGLWISAAVLTGVVLTARTFSKRKVVYVRAGKRGARPVVEEAPRGLLQAGLAMGALRFAAVLLRPVVVSFVTKKLGGYARRAGERSGR